MAQLKRLLRYAGAFRRQFLMAALLAIGLAVLGPLRPYLVELTVDRYIFENNFKGLVIISLISLGVLLVESAARFHFIYITNWLGQHVVKNVRMKVFGHTIHLRLSYFDRTAVGTSTTRTINDLETINSVFTEGIIQIIADLLTIIFVIVFMMISNWRMALISMVSFPLILYATYIFKEGIKSTFQSVRTQVARLNAFLQERITGMRIVQAFTAEDREYEKFRQINDEHRKANIRSVWYYSIFFPVVEIITALALALMVWYGAQNVINGTATVGQITAFILYLNMLFRPLRMLADKFNTLQMGFVAAERVFAVLDNKEFISNNGTKEATNFQGKIDFENVWFAYNGEEWVIKDLNFTLMPGQTLAIVGATGAGKSSIINILNRFYDIQQGTIKIDDTDIREFELGSLRQKIGMVMQDVFLFSGTIMENITLHNDSITEEEVHAAARMLGAHDFIMRLPNNYGYNVMERGATLSLGQRQLISFVRALVYNPAILILDEATSSVDIETEQVIQSAVENLINNRTSIVIAHRLSTIQHADTIMVLEKGKVVEAGNHYELLAADGAYRKLHEMQFKEAEEE
ncbi:MAG: antibiotic ABC transporter ATP-binding protein [Sphingobacteriales bacterium BACL12 MAG-120813-bin55]|nr:MAG: antibiotic ABC transporter ATP-binding protein [Sphingobacteriales bacterium BACL12 MAG-120802-bin5]KRP12852.1 MAG: antibiotic ABC transporter ATP-binding protein [Sphingobacteriales bacterium BACL12 MAG-120813-bin55]